LRGFLVRKYNEGTIVKDDIIVTGIICEFEETDLHGNFCNNPKIFHNGKIQDLTNARKTNKLFIEILKTKDGINWKEAS
jgi:hypothetical protein